MRTKVTATKGINVQTKPLAVSKINSYSRWPGLQRATSALRRNACSHVSQAAAQSCEPKEHSSHHRNATLINYFDTSKLKSIKDKHREIKRRVFTCQPTSLLLSLINTHITQVSLREKLSWRNIFLKGCARKLLGNHLCHKNFSRGAAARKKSSAVKANILI